MSIVNQGLTPERIAFTDDSLDWKDAIRLAGKPLVEDGTVEARYLEAVIQTALKHGPYFDMGLGIAMPHARPEEGANRVGLAFLRTRTPVLLLDDPKHSVDIFIMLAATDSSSHIDVMAALSQVLTNPERLEGIRQATTAEEVLAQFPN